MAPRFIGGRPLSKLFTHHDKFRLHAFCGLFTVLHALVRLALWLRHGRCFFAADARTLASLLPHVALSLSGLAFFPVSSKRSGGAPLLWAEGRLHSAIFAARSLACIALCWLSLRRSEGQPFPWLYLRGPVVLLTCMAADAVSARHAPAVGAARTTMRDMPWPAGAGGRLRVMATLYYSVSQLAATAVCLLSYRMDDPFWVMCIIQASAFLFTLVRKGVLSAAGWHVAYALLLGSAYALLILVSAPVPQPGGGERRGSLVLVLTALLCFLRFGARADKYAMWSALTLAHWAAMRWQAPAFEFVTTD